jgi:hypothetical protein
MSRVTVQRGSQVFLCVIASIALGALSALGACGAEAGVERGSDPAFDVTRCSVAQAGGGWVNRAFVAQPAKFSAAFTATPSASALDAVVGLSDAAASGLAGVAGIVRFHPSGTIDVRDGSGYRADVSVPYTAGQSVAFRIDVDVAAHSYSVAIDRPFGGPIALASGYSFPSEQAQAAQLGNLAAKVDSGAGSLEICALHVVPVDADGCPVAEAGLGFVDRSIGQPGEVVVTSDFVVKPAAIVDGVIGLSQSGAASFDDLAAAVRLAPGGAIDARDGAAYRADAAVPYAPGQAQRIRIVAVVPTHTFSVYVAQGETGSQQLARGYAFRPTAEKAAWLGNLDAIVDSPGGAGQRMSLCNVQNAISIGVRLAREGNYAVAPLPGDDAVVSDGTTTLHLSASGAVLARAAAGGQVAVDASGNVYLARITGNDLVVDAYTPGLALRWTRSFAAGAGHRALAIGADGASVVAAAGPGAGGVDLVKRWLADGTESTVATGPVGDAIAIGSAGYAIGSAVNGTVSVARWSFGRATPDWQRSWPGKAHIDALAVTPSGGVAFAGTFAGTISFGGPTLTPAAPGNVFVAALSPTGDPAFSRSLPDVGVRGLASNGQVTALSAMLGATVHDLVLLDSQGQPILGAEGDTGFGRFGTAGSVAVAPSGRVFWNFADAWPTAAAPAYPYLISLVPGT